MHGELILPFHDWLVGLRRHFHQYPELACNEKRTAGKIAEVLSGMGIDFQAGIGGTGVVAALEAERAGPTVALRADMDALPIEEKNEVPYRSKHPGVMHACGHDGHVAMALGTARFLVENGWRKRGAGKVLFVFQPAEEGGGGALAMLESGYFDAETVEAVFAGHMHPEIPAGRIGVAPEVCNAASDNIVIELTGKGGHGAQPHLCIDPIVAGAHLVAEIQSVIGRSIHPLDSAVATIGKFHAGSARNVIPEEALLEGTVRTLRPSVRKTVLDRLEALVKGLEVGFGVRAKLDVIPGYPLLVNDPGLVRHVLDLATELLGEGNVRSERPRMGAEDFAYFAGRWPGVLIRIGCRESEEKPVRGLHSPWFDFDETALDCGVRLFARLLENIHERGISGPQRAGE